jgi:hypothetical protein
MVWVPLIDWSAVAPDEREAARALQTQLLALPPQHQQYASAVELLEYALSEANGASENWAMIAGGHAVLTLYHFRATIHMINAAVGACGTLKRRINTKEIHGAAERFEEQFPAWLPMRNGVAHAADKRFKNFDYWSFIYEDQIHGLKQWHALTFEQDGQRYSQTISQWELDKLSRLRADVFRAFRKVSELP